jgi:hypothetical protein
VLHGSAFEGCRIALVDLYKVLDYYGSTRPQHATRVEQCASHLKLGRHVTGTILSKLRSLEAAAGFHKSRAARFSGNLEADGHGVKRCYVSAQNPSFQKEVKDAVKRHKGVNQKVYTLYVRVAGLLQRGRSGVSLSFLDFKLIKKGGKPPPEEFEEVKKTNLLKQIRNRGQKSTLFMDGAEAWVKAKRDQCPRLSIKPVSHRQMEFTRKNIPTRKGEAKTRGTQAVDRRWQGLDRYLPAQVVAKHRKDVNGELATYIYSWVWRTWLPSKSDLLSEIGKLCSQHEKLGWETSRVGL